VRGPRLPFLLAAGLLGLSTAACTEPVPLGREALAFAGTVADEVSEERLMATVSELTEAHVDDVPLPCSDADRTEGNRFCHLTNGMARTLVAAKFEQLDYDVGLLEHADARFPTSTVIAEVRGESRPDEIVLVGAHLDAFFAGADDNASGLAIVLELARILRHRPVARTVRFVAFDLEEVGLIGSTRYVQKRGANVKAALILDCVGYYDERPNSQKSLPGLPAPSRGTFLAVIANANSTQHAVDLARLNDALDVMQIVSVIAPGRGDYPAIGALLRSDHTPFWLHDAPALFLTDTADFRNPNYHKKTDTIDTLNPRLFTKAAQLTAATIAYWAATP
jgi:hypothetical protein